MKYSNRIDGIRSGHRFQPFIKGKNSVFIGIKEMKILLGWKIKIIEKRSKTVL